MADIPANVAGNLVQRLVDGVITEAKYLCCFKCFVEDFEKEQKRLSAERKSVGEDIDEARQRNENQIGHKTQQWLTEADSLIQEDTQAKKKWFFGLCTNCIWQYGRGKELFQKTQEISKLIERRNNLVRVARPDGPPGMNFYYSPDFIHFESRKAKFEHLKEALKNSNNHLVGLQGMGGTGKTTMATQVGKEVEESKLFDKVIFTVVSNSPNVEKVRSDIAKHLVSQPEDAKKLEDAGSLWSRISNGEEKILIILDDVWEKELDLKVIGIPVGRHDKGRCSVFLTTRDLKVCKAMGCQETIQVEVLPNEEALNLFLFHADKCGVDSSIDFKDVALDIVKGCGGLPVAIEAIAKSLNYEPLQVWKDTSTALQKFDPILYDVDGGMKKAYNCLKLSYDNLKNEKAKELFRLCSLFPEDFEIPVELLSRIAIGLGLCGEVDEYNKARRQLLEVKRKLVYSSLLLADEENNVKMHDLVHEVAIKIANKEIQVVRDSKTTLKENVRFSSWIDGFPHRFNGSKLEILIIFITSFVEFPDALFEGMTKLRVLVIFSEYDEIQGSSLVKSIQSLINIRSLQLANLELEDISSMGNLQSLETLELFRCSIVELPNEITKLENLRLLGLIGCDIERNNPFEVIERCSRLEELYYRNNSDIVKEKLEDKEACDIGIPPILQMYDISGEVNHYYSSRMDASLLKRFKPCYFQNIFSEAAIKFLAAKAEILELDGDYGTGWRNLIPDMASIEDGGMIDIIKLSLCSFPEMECLIHTKNIGSEVTIFSKLVELILSTMGVKELCVGPFPSGFLKKLEKLNLYKCSNLEGTLFKGKLDLGKLKRIKLEKCSMSSLFHPSTAQSLKQLEELEISYCCKLKYIITDEGLGEDKVEDDTANPIDMSHGSLFSELKLVHVESCDKLEFILPMRFVEDLPLLEKVNIFDCEKLKHIFGQHQDNDEGVSYQKGKEIKLPSLQEMRICQVPNFINIFPAECCHHPMSPVMKNSSPTKDDLKVKDPSLSCTFSWALVCCFMPKATATSIDNPIVSEAALPNRTGLQELKTQVFKPAECFLRSPLDPRNLREITIRHCSNFTWLFTLSFAASMPLLETLEVGDCNGLKHIFTNDRDDDDHKKYSSVFPKLKKVYVWYCDLLESLFPASLSITLDYLEVLKISNTPKLRYVLGKCDCNDNLPHQCQSAQECRQDVPNMDTAKCLLRQPLLHLRKLSIHSSSNCTSLFTLSIASSMSLLESLQVTHCHGLKHIVTNEGNNDHDHMNYSSIFPNLKQISVYHCSFLEYIFPASHCRSLNRLESVIIIGVNKLRYVFEKCYCEDNLSDHNQNVEIHLPALKYLRLDVVPNMVSIGTQNCYFTALSLKTVHCPPSVVSVFQGIDFQKVPRLVVIDCPDDDDKHSEESHQEIVEYIENPASETNSQLQEEAQAALSKKKLSPSHSKKEVVENELMAMQMKNNNTPNLTKVPTLEKAITPSEIIELEPSNASSTAFIIPLQNESPQDMSVCKEAKNERSNENAMAIPPTFVEMKDLAFNSVVTECEDSSASLNETAGGVDKPLDNTQEVEEPTNQCSSKERSNITTLAIPPTLVDIKDSISFISSTMKPHIVSATSDSESGVSRSNLATISGNSKFPQDDIIVNQTEIDNRKQFEEDDLIRLFQLMEDGADMEVHKPYVSKIAAVEDDNKVAKAFSDLEVSLKMGLNEIASSEENSLHLQNALNLLSTHFSEDGAPSHGLSARIDSLHQEFQNILSSFKQASSTVHAFTKLEDKEKCIINEELPRRKQEARTLVSEIFKTEKSMVEAQQKEAELKELISRLQAELNSKEKETKDCEIKLLSLKEQKKNSVLETMRFMKEFEDVKKDKSQMMEEEIKARQELEKVDVKWSSCVANLRKTTLLLGIHINHNL